ncbi:MAG: hypothetical protein ACFBZ8_06610 [Opitutales bacterium]
MFNAVQGKMLALAKGGVDACLATQAKQGEHKEEGDEAAQGNFQLDGGSCGVLHGRGG